jgi:hypothetical protein
LFLKNRKDSTDPRLRSLLQKAVRRGHVEIAEAAARRLELKGDGRWLRSRTIVVTFEEVWPLAADLRLDAELRAKLTAIKRAASAVKRKDAAGLGALAWAFHDGDSSMLDVVPNTWAVRVIAEALNRPPAFFQWAESQCTNEAQRRVIATAHRYLSAASWGWDKACILAGAFLAATQDVPEYEPAAAVAGPFPYWVALDKHTPEGKIAFRAACREAATPYRQAIWSGFYFESAVVNELRDSPWWTAERTWRLRRVGMTEDEAMCLWRSIRPALERRLAAEAEQLERDLYSEPLGPLFGTAEAR